MKPLRPSLGIILSLFLASCGLFDRGIQIEDAWVRPALAGSNSAVYFRLVNAGGADRLIGVVAEAAPEAAAYRTRVDAQGMMHMDPQELVPIPAESEIAFEPGGLHVMLVGLTRDLLLDERTTITLVFEKGGELTVEVPVESH